MTPLDYDFLRQALKQQSGLALGADKHYFVESRLLPLARQGGHSGVGELVLALKTTCDAALMTAVVEAMTTSESFFFRDKTPFDHFRRLVMPALLAARRQSRAVRIWCAAAASAGCRLSCSSNISRKSASNGRSLRKFAPWSNIATSIFLRILRRLEPST